MIIRVIIGAQQFIKKISLAKAEPRMTLIKSGFQSVLSAVLAGLEKFKGNLRRHNQVQKHCIHGLADRGRPV